VVEAEHGHSAEPEQCCLGWPSSASRAERTAPASGEVASVAAGQYPGCFAPAAGQNQCSWCSPSDGTKDL